MHPGEPVTPIFSAGEIFYQEWLLRRALDSRQHPQKKCNLVTITFVMESKQQFLVRLSLSWLKYWGTVLMVMGNFHPLVKKMRSGPTRPNLSAGHRPRYGRSSLLFFHYHCYVAGSITGKYSIVLERSAVKDWRTLYCFAKYPLQFNWKTNWFCRQVLLSLPGQHTFVIFLLRAGIVLSGR